MSFDSATNRLLEDAADRRLDQYSLLEAALIAEGINDSGVFDDCNDRLRRYQHRLGRRLRNIDAEGASPEQRVRIVHEFLHDEILTGGYQRHSTSVAGALRRGSFNCVSSSILFCCLCSELDLPTVVAETSGHVWMRLVGPGATRDIQTTVARWQDATHFGPRRGARSLAAAQHSPTARQMVRQVGELELVAMIYYNRGVDLLHQKDYDAAARMNRIALTLDPHSPSARANLLASLNNRTVQLTEQEDFRSAREALLRGLSLDGRYVPLLENDLYLHHQWIASLCRRGRFSEALEVLDAAHRRRAGEPFFRQTKIEVCRRWAKRLLAEGSPREAIALLELHCGCELSSYITNNE